MCATALLLNFCVHVDVHVGKVKYAVWWNACVSLYGLEKLESGRLDVLRVCSAAEQKNVNLNSVLKTYKRSSCFSIDPRNASAQSKVTNLDANPSHTAG